MFTVTLDEALALLAAAEDPGRRRPRRPPLRELGDDPVTGKPMVVKDGRFGPYVTDGETNATLRKGDAVETITIEPSRRAARRPAGARPPLKKAAKKAPAKKAAAPRRRAAKKTAAKKTTAKKTTAKKTTAKKTAAKKAAAKKATQVQQLEEETPVS